MQRCKNKYKKYLKKLSYLDGGLLCHPEINTDVINTAKYFFKYSGDHMKGFRRNDSTGNYTIRPIKDSFGNSILLGEGGMGKVYKGKLIHLFENVVNTIFVAVKILKAGDNNNKMMICNELTSVMFLNHSNIVKYYGYAEIDKSDR